MKKNVRVPMYTYLICMYIRMDVWMSRSRVGTGGVRTLVKSIFYFVFFFAKFEYTNEIKRSV
jgi:hypothetical protein